MTTVEISDAYERGLLGAERWYAAASRRVELDEVEAFERGELRTAPSCYGRYRDAWPPKRHTGVGAKAPPIGMLLLTGRRVGVCCASMRSRVL